MGFYFGSSTPPEGEEKPGTLKEALLITWAVFRTLALPIAILLGGVVALVTLFFLFAIHPLLGLAGIGAVVLAVVLRGLWEWRHPPTLPG